MMSQMTSEFLAEKIQELRPNLKIQLTSGLADKTPGKERQAELRMHLLQKPYSQSDLISCINKFFKNPA